MASEGWEAFQTFSAERSEAQALQTERLNELSKQVFQLFVKVT